MIKDVICLLVKRKSYKLKNTILKARNFLLIILKQKICLS